MAEQADNVATDSQFDPIDTNMPRDPQAAALLIFIHGGGHVVGGRETDDIACRHLAMHGDVLWLPAADRVQSQHWHYAGMIHGFISMTGFLDAAHQCLERSGNTLRKLFDGQH